MMCFPLKGETRFCIFKKLFLKWFGVTTYFSFIFKKEKNKKKKNLNVTNDEKKQVWEKPNLGPGIRLLIKNVRWKT